MIQDWDTEYRPSRRYWVVRNLPTAVSIGRRFQWTYPILISPHDPDVLYIAGNVLFRSTDEGVSWEVISPDLTRDDKSKQEA